jgi:hypothetical protein
LPCSSPYEVVEWLLRRLLFFIVAILGNETQFSDTNLLREMVKTMTETLMSAEADSVCNTEYKKAALAGSTTSAMDIVHANETPAPVRSIWGSEKCEKQAPKWRKQRRRAEWLSSRRLTCMPKDG